MIVKILKDLKIDISWKMIYLGLCNGAITAQEAIDYAIEQVEAGNNMTEIFELLGAYADDFDYILILVQSLQEDYTDEEFEYRKIRLAIVYEVIKEKRYEFIDGLMELTDLWAKFGFPEDSPHIIQGWRNLITPSEYYTQENYDKLYEANCVWFKNELLYLQENRK